MTPRCHQPLKYPGTALKTTETSSRNLRTFLMILEYSRNERSQSHRQGPKEPPQGFLEFQTQHRHRTLEPPWGLRCKIPLKTLKNPRRLSGTKDHWDPLKEPWNLTFKDPWNNHEDIWNPWEMLEPKGPCDTIRPFPIPDKDLCMDLLNSVQHPGEPLKDIQNFLATAGTFSKYLYNPLKTTWDKCEHNWKPHKETYHVLEGSWGLLDVRSTETPKRTPNH